MSTQTAPTAPTMTVRAADLRPFDVVTIPDFMLGAGERVVVCSHPQPWPHGRIVECGTRAADGSGPGTLALHRDSVVQVHRALTADAPTAALAAARRVTVAEHFAALDGRTLTAEEREAAEKPGPSSAVARQVARAEQASGGTVATCAEHGAYIRSFGGSIGCTNTGESCDLSWGDLADHADGRTLAWHHDFLTVSA